jgi:hypothetical protein
MDSIMEVAIKIHTKSHSVVTLIPSCGPGLDLDVITVCIQPADHY